MSLVPVMIALTNLYMKILFWLLANRLNHEIHLLLPPKLLGTLRVSQKLGMKVTILLLQLGIREDAIARNQVVSRNTVNAIRAALGAPEIADVKGVRMHLEGKMAMVQ